MRFYNAVISTRDVRYAFARTNKTVALVSHVPPKAMHELSDITGLHYAQKEHNSGAYLSREWATKDILSQRIKILPPGVPLAS